MLYKIKIIIILCHGSHTAAYSGTYSLNCKTVFVNSQKIPCLFFFFCHVSLLKIIHLYSKRKHICHLIVHLLLNYFGMEFFICIKTYKSLWKYNQEARINALLHTFESCPWRPDWSLSWADSGPWPSCLTPLVKSIAAKCFITLFCFRFKQY